MNKEKLEKFIRLLQKVRKQPSQTFDLGLIIKEPKSKASFESIFRDIKKKLDIKKITYDKKIIDEDIIEELIDSFKKEKWVFLEIKKDIGSLFLNQLIHLSNRNFLQLLNYNNQDVFEIKMPENSRIIIFTERDFIKNKITYPHFYRLFGPTLSIK